MRPKLAFSLFPFFWAFGAVAQPSEAPPTKSIVLPKGGGQSRLEAKVVGNELVYRACGESPCPASAIEERIDLGQGDEVELKALSIGLDRHVLWAKAPGFDAIVAASLEGANRAQNLFSGRTGFQDGLPGERKGQTLQIIERGPDGAVHVVLGEEREDVTICGRTTLLTPRLLDPRDLAWKPARLERLDRKEREDAKSLTAKAGEARPGLVPILRARVATSAVGDPAALTDGDLETTWAEGRKGVGKGEFVQLDVARDVPITGLSFVIRPPKRAIAEGASPSRFWLATDDALFSISLPKNAWSKPGRSFEISFDEPVETTCMTIVLDEASAPANREQNAEVGFAEIIARTTFDEAEDPVALVGALAGGGARARAARAMLQRAGDEAFRATAERFDSFDEAGRALALEVLDVAPCEISAPVYLDAALSSAEGQAHHGRDRLRRCGPEAGPSLLSAIVEGPDERRILAAQTLSLAAPELAVSPILEVLPKVSRKTRAELRAALARSASALSAENTVVEHLRDDELATETLLALLRALPANRPTLLQDGSSAFQRLLGVSGEDFRLQYLLLEPASRLARGGAEEPLAALRQTLADSPNRYLRTRAAELAGGMPELSAELLAATRDPEPRVRQAAIFALGNQAARGGGQSEAFATIVERLKEDAWTFVRADSADALALFPRGEEVDIALGEALGDANPNVRARAVEAIGKRGAVSQVSLIRERLESEREFLDVRIRAARALGELCDRASTAKLVQLAQEGGSPMARADAQRLAMAAISALGKLQPPDLREKLAPLLGEGTPRVLSVAIQAALGRREGVCLR